MQGADEPRRYPRVGGDGGKVPFTPNKAPKITDEILQHIMTGEPKGRRWSGGHAAGMRKGKSEFPQCWDADQVKTAIDDVLRAPDSITRQGASLRFRGVVDGVPMVVITRGRQGPAKIWTAYPESVR